MCASLTLSPLSQMDQIQPAMMPTTTTTSSCSSAATLPEDIQAEILKWLPVRTLARFSCVCKSWRRLFSDPSFVSMHLHLHSSTAPTRIILSRYFKTLLSIPPNHNPNPYSPIPAQELHLSLIDGNTYYVKGHCNGLLCLILSDGTIVLWNPSIGHYKTLPVPLNFKKTREVLGIGFDPSHNDYKIIRFPSAYCKCKVKDYHPQVEIFTLGSNYWRKLPDEETPPYFVEHFQQSITLNGAIYWATVDDFSTVILRFDLTEEKFSVLPPQPQETGRNISWVGVLKESLCVIHSHRRNYFHIWATQDDRNWAKMVSVSKISHPKPCLSSLDYVPLCFVESGELIMSVRGNGLVAYDPERDWYRMVAAMEDSRWLQETVCTETLVSPLGYGEGPLQQKGSSNSFPQFMWGMLVGVVDHFTCRGSATKKK